VQQTATATAQQAESRPLTWLADYRPPPYTVDDVHLTFNIEDAQTTISSTLRCRRNREQHEEAMPPIVLDGGPPSDLTLLGVTLDRTALRAGTDFRARSLALMRRVHTHTESAHSLTLQVLLLLCG
jgi:aminopeptidase N